MHAALVLATAAAALLCGVCVVFAIIFRKRNATPARQIPLAKSQTAAGGTRQSAGPEGARPAIGKNCIFGTNFVIGNATGKSASAGPPVTNPLKQGADPGIVNVGGTYYLTSTMSSFEKSRDLRSWTGAGQITPGRQYWAPELVRVGGVWWCVFCDGLNAGCHALRSSGGVGGPYSYSHPVPVQPAMDPSVFVDADNKCYILTSSVGAQGGLWVHEISPDLKTVGKGAVIAKAHQQPGWMREPVAEGGQMLCRVADGKRTYYAVFSGNGCCHAAGANFYALGYATASTPLGPWTLSASNPILGDAKSGVGYGHHCFYQAHSGALGIMYQRESGPRELCVSKAWFDTSGRLAIEPPQIGTSRPSP